jgi:hypothetical protein
MKQTDLLFFLKDNHFKKIFNWKCRYFINEKEDIKQELIIRVLENPNKEWSIYNLSNELNKIISPIKIHKKYICDNISNQLNENTDNIDFSINNFNKINIEPVNKKFNISKITNNEIVYDDFKSVFIPIFKDILKTEEFILFLYLYINGEKLSDIKKSTKLPHITLTYIHKNMKTKIKDYLSKNQSLMEEFLTLTKK